LQQNNLDATGTISRLPIFYVSLIIYFYHVRYWLVVGWKFKLSRAEFDG
jgi:hypothetical protein